MARKDVPSAKPYPGFNVLFSYVQMEGEDVPVMAICNPKNRSSYLIPLPNAFQFADSVSGEPTPYLVEAAHRIAEQLDLYVDRHTTYSIASAVVDNLPLLIEMPPKPAMTEAELMRKVERSELVIRDRGEIILDAR